MIFPAHGKTDFIRNLSLLRSDGAANQTRTVISAAARKPWIAKVPDFLRVSGRISGSLDLPIPCIP
jgi:hypothetical protein